MVLLIVFVRFLCLSRFLISVTCVPVGGGGEESESAHGARRVRCSLQKLVDRGGERVTIVRGGSVGAGFLLWHLGVFVRAC